MHRKCVLPFSPSPPPFGLARSLLGIKNIVWRAYQFLVARNEVNWPQNSFSLKVGIIRRVFCPFACMYKTLADAHTHTQDGGRKSPIRHKQQ